MTVYTFSLPGGCDPGRLHKELKTAGFVFFKENGVEVGGISYDDGTKIATINLDPSETKDPTSIVNAYVYVPYVPPNYPVLYTNAQATVTAALATYNTAVAGYTTALATYNTKVTAYTNAGIPVTSGNAVAHIQPLADAMQAIAAENAAFALAFPAVKDAISALVGVVTVLAQRTSVDTSLDD
jgi:hypothetical protein